MSTTFTIETKVRFRKVRNGRKKLEEAPATPPPPRPEPVPRIARLMALAIHFDRQIRAGVFASYSDIARHLDKPKAARAVGAAVGRNPISFVVPCHRVLGRTGGLTGYHWGLTRKRAILGWEAGLAAQD